MNVKIFYHICAINHCVSVVEEQMAAILYSGLYGSPMLEGIYCFLTAKDDFSLNYVKNLLLLYGEKIKIVGESLDTSRYERFTLESIGDYLGAEGDTAILYIHTKGVSQTEPEKITNVLYWTRALNYHMIGRWRECLAELKEHDVVGTYYAAKPLPHFQGNFWWARADYFKKLPATIGAAYLEPELNFLFQAQPRWKAMAVLPEYMKDLYKQPLKPEDYTAEPVKPAEMVELAQPAEPVEPVEPTASSSRD
jgi:hypothetical protein